MNISFKGAYIIDEMPLIKNGTPITEDDNIDLYLKARNTGDSLKKSGKVTDARVYLHLDPEKQVKVSILVTDDDVKPFKELDKRLKMSDSAASFDTQRKETEEYTDLSYALKDAYYFIATNRGDKLPE